MVQNNPPNPTKIIDRENSPTFTPKTSWKKENFSWSEEEKTWMNEMFHEWSEWVNEWAIECMNEK